VANWLNQRREDPLAAFVDQEFRVSISPPPAIVPMAVVPNWQAALKK
jgi:hypothetical protein